ncbi:MAG: metallophosphoesterase family protein [Porphyromonadaceae bacterium]|nr:MAG: metallophosphoesterase family protein [Porphyromonadaceae bacterium]
MRKNFILIASLFLFASAFGQSTESLRITHGPWLQNLTAEGVTVCWTTNLPAVPGVWMIRTKPQTDSLVRNSTDGLINAGGTIHKVRISGLQPGMKYAYKLHSVELMKFRPYQIYYGDTVKGKEFSFTTQNHTKDTTRFMVVNDIHNNGAMLAGFLKSGNAAEQDLLVYNGDIVDNFETESQLLGPVIDTSVRYFASNVPFAFIRGNHEARGVMARKLKDYLDFPDNHYYYSIDQGPVHFVMLDCGEDKPDDNRYYYGLADFDNYRLQQLEWLKEHMKTAAYRNAAFRVIIIHMPILPLKAMGYGSLFLYDHFSPVIRDAGADLLIAGHAHKHLWLGALLSGFGFPMLINSNTNFVQVEATNQTLSIRVVSETDGTILSKELQRR